MCKTGSDFNKEKCLLQAKNISRAMEQMAVAGDCVEKQVKC